MALGMPPEPVWLVYDHSYVCFYLPQIFSTCSFDKRPTSCKSSRKICHTCRHRAVSENLSWIRMCSSVWVAPLWERINTLAAVDVDICEDAFSHGVNVKVKVNPSQQWKFKGNGQSANRRTLLQINGLGFNSGVKRTIISKNESRETYWLPIKQPTQSHRLRPTRMPV